MRPFRFLAPSAFPPDLDLVAHNPQPIGTGAYMLVESKLGAYDIFAKNPHYWDAERLAQDGGFYYDFVRIKVIFEPTSKMTALRAGQVDMLYGYDEIPTRIFQEAMEESMVVADTTGNTPAIKAYLGGEAFVLSLLLNSTRLDSKTREAIALSIDKPTLINAVYGELVSPADSIYLYTDFVIPHSLRREGLRGGDKNPQSPANLTPTQYTQNLQKAREILATLGYTQANPLRLELLFAGDKPSQKMLSQILQSQLKHAHIALHIRALEPSMLQNRQRNGDFDIVFGESWGAPYEPLSMLFSYTAPSGHADFIAQSGLENKNEIDALILQVVTQPNVHEAQILAHRVIDMLLQSNVYIPLAIERNKAIARSQIKGVEDISGLIYEIPVWEFWE